MGKDLQVNGELARISRKGFFYESNNHSITWQFEADRILSTHYFSSQTEKAAKELKDLKDCIPLFRQEYLKAWWGGFEPWGDWLLIRRLKMLRNPIKGERINRGFSFGNFKYFSNPRNRMVPLTSSHLRAGNSFILRCPDELELLDPEPEAAVSNHLKQFLMDRPPPGKLRERIIHNAFLIKLMKEGYVIENEREVTGGRLDVLFRDKHQNLIAVELKLRRGDPAISQLEDYIGKLQEDYDTRIHGAIVCGQADAQLRKKAKARGFEVIEYELILDIPLHEIIT